MNDQQLLEAEANQTSDQTGSNDDVLNVELLEERIAPGLNIVNRCETLLDIEVLEERVAPGLLANRCETLVL